MEHAYKSSLIRIVEAAVHKAGRALSRDFGEVENLQVSRKGPGDFVSSADHRAEKILVEELSKSRPDYGFLVEEKGEIPGKDPDNRWIIDPLDGTSNFLHGVPHFCVSVGLEQRTPNGKKEIVLGAVYAPVLQEFYWAEKGQGAFVNDRRLGVSARNRLEECLVGAYIRRDPEAAARDLKMLQMMPCSRRILGSAALELAYVAAGKLDGFWHHNLKPWDMAAGMLLVREARGMVTEVDGGSRVLESGNILASNEPIHDQLLKQLAKFRK